MTKRKILIACLMLVVCAVTCFTVLAACDDLNGGGTLQLTVESGLPQGQSVTIEIPKNTAFLSELNKLIPSEKKFTFAGWFLSDGTAVGADTVLVKDTVVSAKWKASYEIEYYLETSDGSFVKSEDFSVQKIDFVGTELSSSARIVNGYTYDAANVGNIKSIVLNDVGLKLKLYYKLDTLTLSFDKNLNAATGSMADVSAAFDTSVEAPDCAFTSAYAFFCWNTEKDGSGDSYLAGEEIVLRKDTKLYAMWTHTYTVEVYTEKTDGGFDKETKSLEGLIGKTATASTVAPENKYVYNSENIDNKISGAVTEEGLTLKVYFELKSFTVTYADDGVKVSVKYGAKFTVRTPSDSNVLSYCTSSTGNGVEYAFGTEVVVTSDLRLFPIVVDVYTAEDGSGDTVRIRRNMTGKGAAVLVKGQRELPGFVAASGDVVTFQIYDGEKEINGKLVGNGKFRYRNEAEVGTYVYLDYLLNRFYGYLMLALDGYGTGVLAVPADDGSDRTKNYFVTYSVTDEGDYFMEYFFPSEPSKKYSDYFVFAKHVFADNPEWSEYLEGYFMIQGYEYGMYGLIYNAKPQSAMLRLNGYGDAVYLTVDVQGNVLNEIAGTYLASQNYTEDAPEYVFSPTDQTSMDAFFFILTYATDGVEVIDVFIIKHNEVGSYVSEEGKKFPELYLDGYGGAMFTSGESDGGRFGYYSIKADGEDFYLVTVTFPDGAGGKLSVRIDMANNLFAVFQDGLVINAEGVLTDYNGESSVIVIPDNVVSIAAGVFKDKNLISVTIPASVTSIGDYSFQNSADDTGKSVLKTVYIYATVPPVLGLGAFRWPNGEFKIYVPDGYEEIYRTAEGWSAYAQYITSSFEAANKPEFEIKSGVLVSYNNKDAAPKDVRIVIPAGVTEIAANVFANRTYIVYVDMNEVTVINKQAFFGCSGITEIVFNENTATIGDEAFYQCLGLTSVDLKEVVTIGKGAFNRCFNLSEVKIGSSISSIGDLAFQHCAVEMSEDESMVIQNELFLTVGATEAPTLMGKAFNGSKPRVYVGSYEIGIVFASEQSWLIYVGSLRVKSENAEQIFYDKSNSGITLTVGDWLMIAEGSYYGLYKIDGNTFYAAWFNRDIFSHTLTIVEQRGAISNGVIGGLQPDGESDYMTFVAAGKQYTYTSVSNETLVVTFGQSRALFNGESVEINIVNYKMQFTLGAYVYQLTLTSDLELTYVKNKVVTTKTYTAADGSTLTMQEGDSISANGQLKNIDGIIRPDGGQGLICETWTWNPKNMGGGVYTWTVYWRSDKYEITVTVSGDTFTYTWAHSTRQVIYTDASGNKAVITEKASNQEVTAIHILFKTANDSMDCVTQFYKMSDTVYVTVINVMAPVYGENGEQIGTEPSVFNGTYRLTLDKNAMTFTLVKN